MTHGGYGYTSRKWGLALDAIVGLDVVLANGTQVYATSTAYPDIFWAMRGAAESFGIITAFYLQTLEAPKSMINFKYEFKGLFKSVSKISSFFSHVQDFARNSSVVDDSLGGLGMYMENGELELRGIYFGSLKDYRAKLEPEMLRMLPAPATPPTVEPLGWLESLLLWGGMDTLATPTGNYSVNYNFFAKSVTVPDASPLNASALNSYFSYMIQQGPSSPTPWYSIINLYGGPGSAINSKNTTFSAYAHRDTLWVVEHQANMPVGERFPDSAIPWLNGLTTNLTSQMPDATFGAYLNYVDPSLTADEAHRLYYGNDVYQRLKSIKTVVDPNNVFSNPQSI
jgi:hypothetical protein